jgi:hypothetical protein
MSIGTSSLLAGVPGLSIVFAAAMSTKGSILSTVAWTSCANSEADACLLVPSSWSCLWLCRLYHPSRLVRMDSPILRSARIHVSTRIRKPSEATPLRDHEDSGFPARWRTQPMSSSERHLAFVASLQCVTSLYSVWRWMTTLIYHLSYTTIIIRQYSMLIKWCCQTH